MVHDYGNGGWEQTEPLDLGLHNRIHVVHQVRHAHIIPVDSLHVLHHLHQTLVQLHLRLPAQRGLYASLSLIATHWHA